MTRRNRSAIFLMCGALVLGSVAPALAGKGGGGGRGGGGGGGRSGGGLRNPFQRRGQPNPPRTGRPHHRPGDGGGNRGGGRGRDRHHHHPGRRFYRWSPWSLGLFGGYGGLGLGFGYYRSPFYDPFYSPYYYSGMDRESREDEVGSGNVIVNVKPSNASVYVDGLLYSSKGKTRFNLPVGTWKLELRAPGYLPQTIELRVEQGVEYKIERKLEKEPALEQPRRKERV
ncbi:MAG: PEGA domain-containing protein [Armatimonadota bacterium]